MDGSELEAVRMLQIGGRGGTISRLFRSFGCGGAGGAQRKPERMEKIPGAAASEFGRGSDDGDVGSWEDAAGRHWKNMQSITEVVQDPEGMHAFPPEVRFAGGAREQHHQEPTITEQAFEAYLMLLSSRYEEYRSLDMFASDLHGRRAGRAKGEIADELASIPPSYFEDSYELSMSRELSALQTDLTNADAVEEMEKRIGHYLMIVEGEIYRRVTAKKHALDQALEQVDTLNALMIDGCRVAGSLRSRTSGMIQSWRDGPMKVASVHMMRGNVRCVYNALSSGNDARMTPQLVDLLLGASDYVSAMEAVHAAQGALSVPPLSSSVAFDGARTKLAEAAHRVDAVLLSDFQSALRESEDDLDNEDPEGSSVGVIVLSIVRLGRVAILLDHLKSDSAEKCERASESISSGDAYVQALAAMRKIVLMSSRVLALIPEELADAVSCRHAICSDAQFRASELVRSQLAALPALVANGVQGMSKVAQVLVSASHFAEESENLLGVRRGRFSALRSACSERALAYIAALHKDHIASLETQLKTEKWGEAPVPREVQALVVELREASTHSSAPARRSLKPRQAKKQEFISLDDDDDDDDEDLANPDADDGAVISGVEETMRLLSSSTWEEGETSDHLYVISEKLKVVESGVRLVRSVVLYVKVFRVVPFGEELGRRAVELIRKFNDLAANQVLGLGATQTAGLRFISARHLAHASQSVSLASALLPLVKGAVELRLPETQRSIFNAAVDTLTCDLSNHQSQILDKIVLVMTERLQVHCSALRTLPWASEEKMRSEQVPSKYMVSTVQETNTLHLILLKVLPRSKTSDVYLRLGKEYAKALNTAYEELDTAHDWVRRRIVADVGYLRLKLQSMEATISTSEKSVMNDEIEKLYLKYAVTPQAASEAGSRIVVLTGSVNIEGESQVEPTTLPSEQILVASDEIASVNLLRKDGPDEMSDDGKMSPDMQATHDRKKDINDTTEHLDTLQGDPGPKIDDVEAMVTDGQEKGSSPNKVALFRKDAFVTLDDLLRPGLESEPKVNDVRETDKIPNIRSEKGAEDVEGSGQSQTNFQLSQPDSTSFGTETTTIGDNNIVSTTTGQHSGAPCSLARPTGESTEGTLAANSSSDAGRRGDVS